MKADDMIKKVFDSFCEIYQLPQDGKTAVTMSSDKVQDILVTMIDDSLLSKSTIYENLIARGYAHKLDHDSDTFVWLFHRSTGK